MRQVVQCLTCGGSYLTEDSKGFEYFHACPPVDNPAFQPDITRPNYDPDEDVDRPNARNENYVPRQMPGKRERKAEEAGRVVIRDVPIKQRRNPNAANAR